MLLLFQPYPPAQHVDLMSQNKDSYEYAKIHIDDIKKQESHERSRPPVVVRYRNINPVYH